jgi:CBS-domain-containing membrane protein
LCCHLFEHVALVFLILPLCCLPPSSTLSHWIVQSTGAFVLPIELIDPHTCFFMFLDWICVLLTLQSCPYILPRFSHFKQVISSMGASAILLHIFQIWCFS